jgi:hypothetical protein
MELLILILVASGAGYLLARTALSDKVSEKAGQAGQDARSIWSNLTRRK